MTISTTPGEFQSDIVHDDDDDDDDPLLLTGEYIDDMDALLFPT